MPVLAEIGENYFVLHRIVSIKGENVVLRGDGNIGTERCKLSDVRAEAIGFYRKGQGTYRQDQWSEMVSIFVSVDKTDASHSASLHTCCLSQDC